MDVRAPSATLLSRRPVLTLSQCKSSSAHQGAYYTQPVYAAQPHVIHHTTVVQPNSIPSALYPAPVPAQRQHNGMAAMGMVAGTTMAMSAGEENQEPLFGFSLGSVLGGGDDPLQLQSFCMV